MTAPRQVLPGAAYLITRRCSQRQLLLCPTELTSQLFGYVLARAARLFGVQVHACCVLSNHYHLVVTDPCARLPAFQQLLDSLIARAMNSILGRWESFWAPSSYSAVALATPEDVLAKVAYVLANPVAAGLVERGRDWPGLRSEPALLGGSAVPFARPGRFFRADGLLPDEEILSLSAPAGFESVEAFRAAASRAVELAEAVARAERTAAGLGFLGAARVLVQRPTARPAPLEARRALNPRVACRDKWKRIEALGRLRTFLRTYRRALLAWRAGLPGVLFPAGTYLARITHGVPCAVPS